MTHVVYDSREIDPAAPRQRWIVRAGLPSLAAANGLAATDANWTAFGAAVSDDAEPGLVPTVSGAGGISRTLTIPATVQRRRAAAWLVHGALQGWSRELAAEGVVHPAATVAIGHDFLFHAHQAVYIMTHRNLLPVGEFENWCQKMALGASDVTSPAEFFRRMEAGQRLAAPAGPTAWVRWGNTVEEGLTTAVRVPLAQAITASGPTTLQAPGNLNLLASDLPDGGLAANGHWIDQLAA